MGVYNHTRIKYCIASLIFWSLILYVIYYTYPDESLIKEGLNKRELLSNHSDCYPKALKYPGLIIFYLFGVFYMFIALSIIVDEFFVPSLEVIAEKWELSNDVAGATLMAAGGSAPELFTSFFGTFQESEIGFAAIVGSAVFNVLFVIAICAFAVPEALQLTWYPLARDCIYYVFALGMLSLFFAGLTPSTITWWEGLILLILYIGYVVIMKYNERIYNKWFLPKKTEVPQAMVMSEDPTQRLTTESRGDNKGNNKDIENNIVNNNNENNNNNNIENNNEINNDSSNVNPTNNDNNAEHDSTNFNAIVPSNNNINSNNNKIPFKAPEKPKNLHRYSNKRGSFQAGILDILLRDNWTLEKNDVNEQFLEDMFNKMDTNKNGVIDRNDFLNDFESEKEEEVMNWIKKVDKTNTNKITMNQFKEFYLVSKQTNEENTHLKYLQIPKGINNKVWYFLTIILIISFVWTIPDVRIQKYEKWRYFSFFISITWIGGFSYFMVEWAEVIGDTLKIPTVVMGLTVLAAGTSVPDLLSSIVVAKQGYADMAVSSSIGSNIFDVLVGLPLPWLTYIMITGSNVVVGAEGLEISVIILLGMVAAVIILIHLFDWYLTKKLGFTMFILYFGFIAQDLARSEWIC